MMMIHPRHQQTSRTHRRQLALVSLHLFLLCISLSTAQQEQQQYVDVKQQGDEQSNNATAIPIIDLSKDSATVVDQVRRACQEIGFFAVRNHGVHATTVERAWEASRDFFDWPLDVKLKHVSENQTAYPYGYEQSEILERGKATDDDDDSTHTGTAAAAAAATLPDLKETFSIGPDNPDAGMPPRRFPSVALQEALEAYYAEMEILSKQLLELFARALDVSPNFFDDKFDRHMCALRILNYPPLLFWNDDQEEEAVLAEDVAPGQIMRAGAHTDYGALTILKSGGPGLQLYREGEWVDVPHLQDAFVINLGDLMQRWTNDKWVSTLHRVVVPTTDDNEKRRRRRQSMAFFVNMNHDAEIAPIPSCVSEDHPPKYETITAGAHLMAKHLASMGEEHDEL